MNEQSHYKQDKTKTRQSINVKSHIFNVRGDNDKTKQTPIRMLSVVRRSLKKETSKLGEIVSLNYIKSNKNVIGLIKLTEIHQVYGKSIPDTLITNEIENSEAYKTFIGLSTGLIPPKIGRGKGAQGTTAADIPKKATTASKKNRAKKIESSDEELEEQEERLHQSGGSSEGVGLGPEVPDKQVGKSAVSDKGVGTSPEWLTTNDDESEEDNEEDDTSIDIEKTNDERMDTDVEDHVKGVAEINIVEEAEKEKAEKVKELKADEEQQGDEQTRDEQVGVPVSTTHKEKPNLLQSTSNHSVSSNFGNQFINSPNASLIGTILQNAEAEINSLLDIQIQQDVPNIQQEPFHAVKVVSDLEKDVKGLKQVDHTQAIRESIKSEVPEAVKKYLGSTIEYTLQKVLQRHTKKLDRNFLRNIGQTHTKDLNMKVSQDDVSKFIKVKQKRAAQEKMPKYSTTPYDQAADDEHKQKEILFQMMMASKSHEKHLAHKVLCDALVQSLLVDENDMDRLAVDHASQRKRRHDDKDQDPSAGSDQGKKRRRTGKDVEPSKKSLKSKKSTKGKTLSTTFKSGKSISADKSVQETEHVVQMDVEEPNLDNVANDSDEPQADAIPKIPNKDWFKKSLRPKTLDSD
ncbi:hypothetical protein Tco_1049693 [Tanacetum coccineum]